jgi:hypothetical protein
MQRVLASVTGCTIVLGSLTHAAGRDAASSAALPRTLIISAAPQDAEVFVAWSPLAGAEYTLRWKAATAAEWSSLDSRATTARAVRNLQNGTTYDFQVEARSNGTPVAVSQIVAATPRPRPGCVTLDYYPWIPRVSFFCTKSALDDYLSQRSIDPLSLRCRQRPVTSWTADAPDCLYEAPGGEQLLLLRSADALFAGANQYPNPADVRRYAREAIWGADDPFGAPTASIRTFLPQTVTGWVTRHVYAQSVQIDYGGGLSTRITWFVPHTPVDGRFSIYHEGHGGRAVEIGAATIDWLLDRGWHVIAVDMPLLGLNAADARTGLEAHGQFDFLDTGVVSPLKYFLSPVKAVVDWIFELDLAQDPNLLLIGRSGGGWTAYAYGAVDPRIDIAVSVAGGRPISERLDALWGAAELGDYEQTTPHLYTAVAHEHLMLAAGSKGSFHIFNRWDGCCFRVQRDSAFVRYLQGASAALGRSVGVFVDEDNPSHSIGPLGYIELDKYLEHVLRPRIPSAPTHFRIVR